VERLAKLVVAGVGLIGGSLALALRARGDVGAVVGIGRSRANLDAARARGIVDRAYTLEEAWQPEVRDASVVLLAAPVAQFPALFGAMGPHLGTRTVVTDAGSTKGDVIAAARAHLGAAFTRFVPAHPIAGSERGGAEAASASLYRDRTVIVTPAADTDAGALALVEAMWQAAGARTERLTPDAHDRIYAAVSHLPHMLAHALVAELAARPDAATLFAHAGAGFRDFTRIAASSPEMWRDVALANRAALGAEIDAYQRALSTLSAAIAAGDGAAIEAILARSQDARRRLAAARWPDDKDHADE
jgi:prephenate dehydrogenase